MVVRACPSFITVLIAMFDTVCVVFLVLNVNDFAAGNSFYDTNITEANMEPFPRRETLPKPNYIVLSNISQPLRASARTGGTSQIVVHRLKEHSAMLHFFPFLFLWGFINLKEGKFIWTIISFVVCCSTFSKGFQPTFGSLLFEAPPLMSLIGPTFETQLFVTGDLQMYGTQMCTNMEMCVKNTYRTHSDRKSVV